MGGVSVVHPQDVLKDRLNYYNNQLPLISSSSSNPSMKSRPNFIPRSNPNPNPNPNIVSKSSNRRKRSPQKKKNTTTTSATSSRNDFLSKSPPKSNNSQLVMGKVKILKRGEALTENTASFEKDNLVKKKDENEKFDHKGSGGLVTKDLVVLPKQIRNMADFYAGSAFFSSPSPSSLPLPAFFKRNSSSGVLTENNNNNNDDDATSDLLRLLKLNL